MDRNREDGRLVLADGSVFPGRLAGADTLPVWGEVVFNTSMTGYQEVVTDPSYAGQIVVMTYPQIGNYGVSPGDNEREHAATRGLVVRELSTFFSPGPSRRSLEGFMIERGIGGLTGVDTRAVALRIRRQGAVVGAIGPSSCPPAELLDLARSNAAEWKTGAVDSVTARRTIRFEGKKGRLAVIDFGAKRSIVDSIRRFGAETHLFPARFSADDIIRGGFDGLVLSNGPGDPTDVPDAIRETRKLIGRLPILGICLGHQIAALAMGGETYKLKFGHRGANQPVKCHRTNKVFLTSQNHGYAVSDRLRGAVGAEITFTNLNDGTVEGFSHEALLLECVQFHPEASPGPHDTAFVFENFFNCVKGRKNAQTG